MNQRFQTKVLYGFDASFSDFKASPGFVAAQSERGQAPPLCPTKPARERKEKANPRSSKRPQSSIPPRYESWLTREATPPRMTRKKEKRAKKIFVEKEREDKASMDMGGASERIEQVI